MQRVEGEGGRLLARVLKEGVQFWYNDTSTVKRGGGVEKTFLWKTFKVYVKFMSVSVDSLFEIFQTHLALRVCAAMLLNYDIFIQPGTPSN
jgi:hypothetical protein